MRLSIGEMKKSCPNRKRNLEVCNCSYTSCEKTGLCCQCVQYHRRNRELPACFFPDDVERGYDRSFRNFIETWKDRV